MPDDLESLDEDVQRALADEDALRARTRETLIRISNRRIVAQHDANIMRLALQRAYAELSGTSLEWHTYQCAINDSPIPHPCNCQTRPIRSEIQNPPDIVFRPSFEDSDIVEIPFGWRAISAGDDILCHGDYIATTDSYRWRPISEWLIGKPRKIWREATFIRYTPLIVPEHEEI